MKSERKGFTVEWLVYDGKKCKMLVHCMKSMRAMHFSSRKDWLSSIVSPTHWSYKLQKVQKLEFADASVRPTFILAIHESMVRVGYIARNVISVMYKIGKFSKLMTIEGSTSLTVFSPFNLKASVV